MRNAEKRNRNCYEKELSEEIATDKVFDTVAKLCLEYESLYAELIRDMEKYG